jgi:SAM-dependent methyltransferase
LANFQAVRAPVAEAGRPSAARMYDYYLGGEQNTAADRALAEQYIEKLPEIRDISRANRRFLRRAVTLLIEQGIDQFLDLGSGMPTVGNVHEIATQFNPHAKVVYVDSDPVTVAHGQALLEREPSAAYLHADLRAPGSVLHSDTLTGHLDLTRPLGVLMVAVLHFVPDQDGPASIVAAYRDAIAPGSYLVLSHATSDYRPETMDRASDVYSKADHTMNFRRRDQIQHLLDGFELLPPGLTDVIKWRPQPTDEDPYNGDVSRYNLLAAVVRLTYAEQTDQIHTSAMW